MVTQWHEALAGMASQWLGKRSTEDDSNSFFSCSSILVSILRTSLLAWSTSLLIPSMVIVAWDFLRSVFMLTENFFWMSVINLWSAADRLRMALSSMHSLAHSLDIRSLIQSLAESTLVLDLPQMWKRVGSHWRPSMTKSPRSFGLSALPPPVNAERVNSNVSLEFLAFKAVYVFKGLCMYLAKGFPRILFA